jgi:Ca2+-binding EF-hand superfamily protein
MPLAPLLFLLAATQAPATPAPAALPSTGGRHWGRLFISPMGEPFRADRGSDPLATWFTQADRNHDGYVTLDEMQADAERFFASLDTNHDGEIDPDEINHYESAIAPEISDAPHYDMDGTGDAEGGHGRGGHGGHHRGGASPRENETHQGAARFGLLDLPEPVSSADADFNRGVSLNEFRQAAGQRFLALDLDHTGKLSLAELEVIRPAPGATPNRPTNSGSGDIDTESIP